MAELERRFRVRPRAEWLDRLRAARVPAGEVRGLLEALAYPALSARGMFVGGHGASGGEGGAVPLLAAPWRSDGVRPALRLGPPRLGEHTSEFMERYRAG